MLKRLQEPLRRFLARPSRRALGAGLVAAALFGPGLWQWGRMSIQQHRLDKRLAALEEERRRLNEEKRRLETDPGYLEGAIRSTFKMAKPGEYVVSLEEPSQKRLAGQ